MILNRKSVLCFVIIQTLIRISYETPTGTDNEPHEEIDESDIEKVIAKKQEEKIAKKEKFTENDNKNDDGNRSQMIKKLEDEKGKLFKQINKAIDESVVLLEHTNDTEAKLGIHFMTDLKSQLKDINGTDIKLDSKKGSIQRSSIGDSRKHMKKKVKITYKEISDLFKGNTANITKTLQGENDIEMQKKIDNWILQRQLEKKRILDYKTKLNIGKREKCPRLGRGKKKIKVNGEKRKSYMPCCRKCCKKSYMGCL